MTQDELAVAIVKKKTELNVLGIEYNRMVRCLRKIQEDIEAMNHNISAETAELVALEKDLRNAKAAGAA
jgi:hypothetical protein